MPKKYPPRPRNAEFNRWLSHDHPVQGVRLAPPGLRPAPSVVDPADFTAALEQQEQEADDAAPGSAEPTAGA